MEKYVEINRQPEFDWNEFLSRPDISYYTSADIEIAKENAMSWITCACGNLCAIIPRDEFGRPEDIILENLGLSFSNSIDELMNAFYGGLASTFNLHKSLAKTILDAIEIRSGYLIEKIKTTRNLDGL